MSRLSIKKLSVVAGLFAFILIFFGSLIYEARIISSFLRGLKGFAIFGVLAWLVLRGWVAITSKEPLGENKGKGANLDQTA